MPIFKLPDLGEGLPDAEISEWHVKVGDVVKLDQTLVAMETAKALVEIPSPFSGQITKLYGETGDIIKTGEPLIEYESKEIDKKNEANPSAQQTSKAHDLGEDKGTVAGKLETSNDVIQEPSLSISSHTSSTIKVTPAVRALAERLKVDLKNVLPSGPNATITSKDVELAAKTLEALGPLELLKGVRRAMAHSMSLAHSEVVPVTLMEDAKLLAWNKDEDITVRLIQALLAGIKREPALNAWYDSKAVGRRILQDVHLGIAMDTTDGLFVPVIHHVEKLDANAVRSHIDTYKESVQNRTVSPEDLRGGTITLSNFGKFAGKYTTPIVVPPMVAILGVGRLREEAVVITNKLEICKVLPLSLTFDHRAVTGGEATRFLGAVIESLEHSP
jgi:2-oxoisovalerate dehydrogenase E2 component (dihydrolipoyl transacylase)